MSDMSGPLLARRLWALRWALAWALLAWAGLYAVVVVHAAGQTLLALTLLVMVAVSTWAYSSSRTSALRYLLPGIAAAWVFVIFPMLYTVGMSFTNYSSAHLLDKARARDVLLQERIATTSSQRSFHVERVGSEHLRIWLAATGPLPALVTQAQPVRDLTSITHDAAMTAAPIEWGLQVATGPQASFALGDMGVSMPERIALLPGLRRLSLRAPPGSDASASAATYTLTSLREFTQTRPLYVTGADGALIDQITGTVYRPDDREGFFVSAQGERLQPGYRVNVGWAHYAQVFSEGKFREPFVSVLAWTVVFSALSVMGAGGLGLLLAVLLNWEGLRGREAYRLVLFLPYAVPGFISILVFKGLFNQNLGEINLILHGLFGLRPAWFSDPLLAKAMLLIVNVWLGFPYMMVLCSGLIKSIPADLYEASAVVGAGPLTNFWRITLPLILKPLTPLLISAFAFNFNNFVLISLLTGGRPDQLDTALPAGTTDILVSYTWRIAFQDSGQQFGLAAAISTVIFLIVAAITLVQMRFTRVAAQESRS